jgi:hypothetical protein
MADEQQKEKRSDDDSTVINLVRTVVLLAIALPVIGWLLYFAYQKNTEMEPRMKACQASCKERDTLGYQFKWTIMSGPVCECVNE